MGGHSLMDWDPAKPPGDEPCGMVAGAVSLPKAMAVLRRIGRGIVNNSRHSTPPPHVPLKTEDAARVKNKNDADANGSSVVWVSSPTLPNETAVLQTAALVKDLKLCAGDRQQSCQPIALTQSWERGAKFLVPAEQTLAVWSIVDSSGRTLGSINHAEPWWSICERPKATSAAAPTDCVGGASLRVFGRALAFSDGACVAFKSALHGADAAAALKLRLSAEGAPAKTIELGATTASCYSADFRLPAQLAPGNYTWAIKNSLAHAQFETVVEDLE